MWRLKIFLFGLLTLVLAIPLATHALTIKQPAEGEQDVRISGDRITDNVLAVGGNVTIDASVEGDLFVAGQSVTINAPVQGNLFAGGNTIELKAPVSGDAFVAAASLIISGEGNISRDLYGYLGTPNENLKDKVSGKIVSPSPKQAPDARQRLRDTLIAGLTLLFTGIVLLRLFPKTVKTMAANVLPSWGKNFLVGIVTLIVVPIVAGFLILSSIGAPVGLVLLALWLSELYVALVVASLTIGQLVLRKQPNELVQYVAGVVVVTAVGLLPAIGSTVKAALVVFGLGSIVLAKYQLYKEFRSRI